jgi:acetyl esterase
MPLHPQARRLLDMVEESGLPPLNQLPAPEARAQAATMRELVGDGPDVAHVEDFTIAGRAGDIPARRYEPDDPAATILWVHGGGWVICDLESHDAMCRLLANSSGCRVIAIDYRLAPEHPFPAPLEDAWDALGHVAGTYGERSVILGGDSAGGNIAAVLAIRARDRGAPQLALQVLVYPVTDHVFTTPSYLQHGVGNETFLTTDEMRWFWDSYLPDETARENPEVSPLRAPDLSGLPPAIVLTAGYDPLRDEGLAYADRLRDAGVPVTRHHYDDMIHAFFSLINLLKSGNEAVEQVGADIRTAVAAETTAPA